MILLVYKLKRAYQALSSRIPTQTGLPFAYGVLVHKPLPTSRHKAATSPHAPSLVRAIGTHGRQDRRMSDASGMTVDVSDFCNTGITRIDLMP